MSSLSSRSPKGQIILLALVFFAVFLTIATALISYVVVYSRSANESVASTEALDLAEAGIDHAAYRLNQSPTYSGETNTPLGSGVFTISVAAVDANTKRITATGYIPNSTHPIATKTVQANLGINSSVVSFRFGVQAGDGGFTLNNSSQIVGNVFSSGPVIGSGGNMIYGTVISSGASGLIYGIHATSSAYAHTLGTSGTPTTVDGDAYYVTKTNTTVGGTLHPNSPDQASASLPITDAQIQTWENQAAAGGTISACDNSGNYTISSNVSLGPQKIACNLVVKSSSGVLNITGPLWVTGNITFQTGPTIQMDPSLGSENVAIIADNPNDSLNSGIITVGQSTAFKGSGASGSFVFLISQNKSAEQGGSVTALALAQGASALVAYAIHGLASLSQSVSVKEVTAYKISLSQSASVTYDTGLPNTLFESGPGGSWTFVPGTYAITK